MGFLREYRAEQRIRIVIEPDKDDLRRMQASFDRMCAKYDAPRATIAADLKEILDTLRSINALEE